MNEQDHDWKKALSDPPLPTRGFSEELMRKILVKQSRSTRRKLRLRVWTGVVASGIAILLTGALYLGSGLPQGLGVADTIVASSSDHPQSHHFFVGSSRNWYGVIDLPSKPDGESVENTSGRLKLYYRGAGMLNPGEQISLSISLPKSDMQINHTVTDDGPFITEVSQMSILHNTQNNLVITWNGNTENLFFLPVKTPSEMPTMIKWQGHFYDVTPVDTVRKGKKVVTKNETTLYALPDVDITKQLIVEQHQHLYIASANGTVTLEKAKDLTPFPLQLPTKLPRELEFRYAKLTENPRTGELLATLYYSSTEGKQTLTIREQAGNLMPRLLSGPIKETKINNQKAQFEQDQRLSVLTWTDGRISKTIYTSYSQDNANLLSEKDLVEVAKSFQ